MPTNNAINNQLFAAAESVASASTTPIGAAGSMYINVTGTTTITAFDTVAAGQVRFVRFSGALTLTHNATTLILPNSGANIAVAAGDTAIFASEGSGNWRCLNYTPVSGAPPAGSGVTGFDGSQNTSSPNNTVNASRLLVNAASTNADFVLQPKGSGAIVAQLPDNAATGGNKRGEYAVDLQMARSSAGQVASGSRSVAIGTYNTASDSDIIALGYNNAVSGSGGVAIGTYNTVSNIYGVAAGSSNAISGLYSGAIGHNHAITHNFATGIGWGVTSSNSDGQVILAGQGGKTAFVNRKRETTSSTPTNIFATSSSIYVLSDYSTSRFRAVIIAQKSNGSSRSIYEISGYIKRDSGAGSVAFIGTPTKTVVYEDDDLDADAVADTTNGGLDFTITGNAEYYLWTLHLQMDSNNT